MCIIGDAGLPRQKPVLAPLAPLNKKALFGKEV